jgi:hypothetical protein
MIEHGSFKITLENNVLVSTFYGAWNKEQVEKYSNSVKQQAQPLLHSSWARVIDLSYWEGAGEEVVQPLTVLQHWAQDHNCKAIAFVNPQLLPQFMLKRYGHNYPTFEVFPTLEQAITSVTSKCMSYS